MHKHNKVAFSNFFLGIHAPIFIAMAVLVGVCVVGMSYMTYQNNRRANEYRYQPLWGGPLPSYSYSGLTSELMNRFFFIVSFVRSLKWLKIQLKKTKNNCSVLQSFISVMFLEIYERCTNAALGFWGELEKRPFYPRFDSCTTGSLTRCKFKNLLGRLLWILLSWFSLKLTACPSYSLAQVALDL